MGYSTDFNGQIAIEPPLSAEEIAYLKKFNKTRRMNRTKGAYYVDSPAEAGQDWDSPDIINHNMPPEGQPELWCGWTPTEDGTAIKWDGGEKFYESDLWMKYLIEHFIGAAPKAKSELPFLTGHTCNGEIAAQGEEASDRWDLIVKDNKVFVQTYELKASARMAV